MTPKKLASVSILLFLIYMNSCSGASRKQPHPVNPNKPIDRVVMEPIVIKAIKGKDGEIKFEAFDAESLFDEGLRYIDEEKPELAVKCFETVINEFPNSDFMEAALFNAAYSREMLSLKENREKNLQIAISIYDRLINSYPESQYIIDAMFRKGYCLEGLGKKDEALNLFKKMLNMENLKTQDRLELKARIGDLLLSEKNFDRAEKELRDTVMFFKEVSEEERIENNFYAAQAQFDIAEVYRLKFEAISFSTEEKEIRKQMEEKLGYMMKAKDYYIETIKIGNYHWAVAGGYRIGMLFRTLYEHIVTAPIPPKLDTEEMKQIYMELLIDKVQPLLKSALSVWEKTLLMAERVGYQGEWVAKVESAMEETMSKLKSDK